MIAPMLFLGAVGAALLAATCNGPQQTVDQVTGALLSGTVKSEAGQPVAGAVVRAEGGRPERGCAEFGEFGAGESATDAEGRYRVAVGTFGGEEVVCVKLRATPPVASSLRADSVLLEDVRFTPAGGDSVHVDFVLRQQ